jgi:hypothetical protein
MKRGIQALGLVAFLSGLISSVPINLLGQVYLGELILALLCGLLIADKCFHPSLIKKNSLHEPVFLAFIVALGVTLLGLILTDFWANSSTSNYLRGWARLVFLGSAMISLSFLGLQSRWNLWWHSLGLGCGGLIYSIQAGSLINPINWKVNAAVPVTLLLLCVVSFTNARIASAAIVALGVVNVALDYRSLGLLCVVLAAIVWSKASLKVSKMQIFQLATALCLALIMLTLAYSITQETYAQRRTESNSGRFASIQVSVEAILRSPLLGHGSWATDRSLANLYLDLSGSRNRSFGSSDRLLAQTSIPSHSQFLQAWVEGGILGTTFFAFLGYRLISSAHYLTFVKRFDPLLPLFLFNLLNSTWNLVSSPFGGSHRVTIAVAVATICVILVEKRKAASAVFHASEAH